MTAFLTRSARRYFLPALAGAFSLACATILPPHTAEKASVGGIDWERQAAADAKLDRTSIAFDGKTPNKMVCDTTLRELPDGSWALFMLAGGDKEPSPKNYTGLLHSFDQGKTWTPLETFNTGFPREGSTIDQGPTELMVLNGRCTLFFSTHARHWPDVEPAGTGARAVARAHLHPQPYRDA